MWNLGLTQRDITLAAHLLDPGPDRYICNDLTTVGYYYVAANAGGDQGWFIVSAFTIPAAHPRFPYGRHVAPD